MAPLRPSCAVRPGIQGTAPGDRTEASVRVAGRTSASGSWERSTMPAVRWTPIVAPRAPSRAPEVIGTRPSERRNGVDAARCATPAVNDRGTAEGEDGTVGD
ncbi:MAG TPA: hypothetical protein VFM50_06755, partial [Nocardioidaceae bacterium]|nr:hypothetical protein [Nocardioidaceae bacterium]